MPENKITISIKRNRGSPKIILNKKYNRSVKLSIKHTSSGREVYSRDEGDYEFTSIPRQDYTVNTKDKIMLYDVTIKKIPYYSVSNQQDGRTIYIGMESEISYG